MGDSQDTDFPERGLSGKFLLKYYYKTNFDNFVMISFDICFEGQLVDPVIHKFPDLPLPTSATMVEAKRVIFHMATIDPLWKNSVYWLRYLVRVEQANGQIASINQYERHRWQWLLTALGPSNEWVDLGPDWPAPV